MDASKEGLIQRLLKEGKISQDDAYLLRKEQQPVQYIPAPPANPYAFPAIKKFTNPNRDWMDAELDRRARIAENCGCNPANGGSGICGCTLTGPVITC
jgi:hypothetical protein